LINTAYYFGKLYCIFVGTNQNKKIMSDFGIQQALKELGLKDVNHGTSTGSHNFSNGELIASYSPVDGKLIGKVKASTKEDYEQVMSTATAAFPTKTNRYNDTPFIAARAFHKASPPSSPS